ncbi:bcl-2-modifying factor isoform X5 [Anomalospiza imberbis]
MDRPSYLEEDYSSLDGLDDDVFHSDDFGLAGSAGYRLHVPPAGFVLDPHLQEEPQEGQREARAEVQIARKLQCIADQFHRLHIQRHQQNRNQVWWQLFLFLHNLALNTEVNRNHTGQREKRGHAGRAGAPLHSMPARSCAPFPGLDHALGCHAAPEAEMLKC